VRIAEDLRTVSERQDSSLVSGGCEGADSFKVKVSFGGEEGKGEDGLPMVSTMPVNMVLSLQCS
jgi:hypothetical protein